MSHDLSTPIGRDTFFDDVDEWLGSGNVICGHISECGVPHGSGRDVHAECVLLLMTTRDFISDGAVSDQAISEILDSGIFSLILLLNIRLGLSKLLDISLMLCLRRT